jgi:4-diphosphocytidyl-2-C-methyl-D-erythritol kinase
VRIEIHKRIPVAAGLGGGSSNAATVLLGLDRLWGGRLGRAGLHPLARQLGADVPFFLCGGTALGLGRGDEVYPLRRQVRGYVVLVAPGKAIQTVRVFERHAARLTARENSNTIFRFVSRDLEGEDAFALLANDLERAALEEAPELASQVGRIRGVLVREGARLALLSGSGSAFFGLFAESAPARRARNALLAAGYAADRVPVLSLERYRRLLERALDDNRPGRGRTS